MASLLKQIFTVILAIFCLCIVFYGIGAGHAVLAGSPVVHYLLLFFALTLLGYLEGLQVAILALERVEGDSFRSTHPRAFAVHKLSTTGTNVQRFLMGRQFFVVFVVFLMALLTTFPTMPKLGLPDFLFALIIDTGLPGALVVLCWGQLLPQLVAATHPVHFMQLPGSYHVLLLCLGFEWLGVTEFAQLLATGARKTMNLTEEDEIARATVPAVSREEAQRRAASMKSALRIWNDFATQLTSTVDEFDMDKFAREGLLDVDDDDLNEYREVPSSSRSSRSSSKMRKISERDEDDSSDSESGALVHAEKTANKRALVPNYYENTKTGKITVELQSMQIGEEDLRQIDRFLPGVPGTGITPNAHKFPIPSELAAHHASRGEGVPRYLLPPTHPKHIPPHIVAFVLAEKFRALDRGETIVAPLPASEHERDRASVSRAVRLTMGAMSDVAPPRESTTRRRARSAAAADVDDTVDRMRHSLGV